MKTTFVRTFVLLVILLVAGLCGQAGAKELDLDFKLVNATGYGIAKIFIGPSTSEDWGDNILTAPLADGQTLNVSFDPKATAEKWDIKVIYEDKDEATWIGYKLEEISKLTLHYDAEKATTSATQE